MANVGSSPYFQDFDEPSVYKDYEAAFLNPDTLNVVVEFDSAKAQAALNVEYIGMKEILDLKQAKKATTRWISIWAPERQKDVVKAIASCYGFSLRLLLLMLTDHDKPVPAVVPTQRDEVQATIDSSRKSVESHSGDIEGLHELRELESRAGEIDLNHYRLVNEVWHFCSVDWGSRYICVGYNSLCNPRRENVDNPNLEKQHLRDKPLGVRYWSWLILCDDGTIVSIQENLFPNHWGKSLSSRERTILYLMRRNLLNIFQQLSRVNDQRSRENHIMTIPVRPGRQDATGHEVSPSDAPSLLFHYLFDDWLTTYSLVARKEHQYGIQLERLRERMFSKPDVDLINDLHHVGRQLAVLKRMYQSYALIIERILERQKPVRTPITRKSSQISDHTARVLHDLSVVKGELSANTQSFGEPLSTQTYGVSLSSAATVRFERLGDRIKLYALSEIQECLDEKDSLVFLNFNLITLKESQAVERLTRLTVLLAKVTILFMPVSLMTAYFSVQVKGLEDAYNATTYWACFGIVMGLSLIFLIVFGKLSGTLEGGPIYRSMTRAFLDFSKAAIGSRRRKKFS